jgi:leader peptidase (prepilin peptidase) / N-methyltransferase
LEAISADLWQLCGSPVALGILGLLVGSFLNVVIHRKPVIMMREWLLDTGGMLGEGEVWKTVFGKAPPAELAEAGRTIDAHLESLAPLGLATPRSRCGACGHMIRWYENIPLLSWLALRAKCSACKTPISVRYPLVELATGVLFALAAWKFGPTPATLAWCAALALLVSMSMIDLDTKYLPDDLTYPLLWGGLLAAALGWTIPLQAAVWGAIAGYVPLWLIASGFALLMKRQGMGGGDLKLLAALGAWLGWQAILPIILMASIVGLSVNVPRMMLGKHQRHTQYPFGPFLALGGLVVIFVGADTLLAWAGISFTG